MCKATNIIESFGNVPEEDSPLGGRWLPGLKSYGLYGPAHKKIKEALQKGYPFTRTYFQDTGAGFRLPTSTTDAAAERDIEEREFLSEAEPHFLKCFRQYTEGPPGEPHPTLAQALDELHRRLTAKTSSLQEGLRLWERINRLHTDLRNRHGSPHQLDAALESSRQRATNIKRQLDQAKAIRTKWLDHYESRLSLLQWFDFLPKAKRTIANRNRQFHDHHCLDMPSDPTDIDAITSRFEKTVTRAEADHQSALGRLRNMQSERQRWQTAQNEWDAWCQAHDFAPTNTVPDAATVMDFMDTELRYPSFKLATHYWEARWLLEMRQQFTGNFRETETTPGQQKRWRRYAKLAPCTVMTFYMAPRHFTAWEHRRPQPLFDFADLLIVDEAGQVAPDTAGATFALAKKALIVGDTLQIQPIWNVPQAISTGNLTETASLASQATRDKLAAGGLDAASGSVMRVAQKATAYQKENASGAYERGMFLAEHRRCVPQIIEYCNELAYKGRLVPKRGELASYPLPHMGYAHFVTKAVRTGGSRANDGEARVIAAWLDEHRDMLEQHYGEPLETIVGVITPFKPQRKKIRDHLRKSGIGDDLTVGTVHALQGAERPVIIFSPVYDETTTHQLFFDGDVCMLNVAVSRAKDSFLVFGNMGHFDPQQRSRPSGLRASFLFADPDNELTDIEPPQRQQVTLRPGHSHLDTLEAHQEVLATGLRTATRHVRIVSPYISAHAIRHDGLPALIQEARNRGVEITVYIDPSLNTRTNSTLKTAASEGIQLLEESGAVVNNVRNEHSKTLMVDDTFLTEGSFNWLSAVRDKTDRYHRRERSLCYEGADVSAIIDKIIQDTESRVIP